MTVFEDQARPMGVGEILDLGIKLAFGNLGTLMRLVIPVVVPVQVLVTLINLSAAPDDGVDAPTSVRRFLVGTVLGGVLSGIASLFATAACFRALGEAYQGHRPEWSSCARFVARRLHSVLWVTILGALFAGLALFPVLVPGIYLAVAYSVAVPVLLAEDLRGRAALKRSRRLVRGRWWSALGVLLVGGILTNIVSGALAGVAAAVASTSSSSDADILVRGVASAVSGVLTTPFSAAFTAILYFDLRVRKEGFDLRLLVDRMRRGSSEAPGSGPARSGPWTAPGD